MLPYQPLQLQLLFQQRSPLDSLILTTILILILNTTQAFHHLPLPFLLLFPLFSLIPRMIHLQNPPHDSRAPQIINRQIRRSLILILQERKTFTLPGLFISHEVEVGRLAELRKYGDDIPFGEVKGKTADVDVGGVAVVGVPGGFGRDAGFELAFVEVLDFADCVHGEGGKGLVSYRGPSEDFRSSIPPVDVV